MSQCYILAYMSNILTHQHQSMPTAYDMMMNLKEMFVDQTRSTRHKAMKDLMNTTMVETTPIRDHVLKMIGLLNELEILRVEIDWESQVNIILQSLLDSYKQFCLNYNMNKPQWTLAQLLKELVSVEGLIKKPSTVLVTEKGFSSKTKGNKKKKKVQKQVHVPQAAPGPQGGVKKPKGKCFHCKQSGHWKKQCPVYLNKVNKQGKSYSLVVETCLAVLSTGT